MAANKPYFVRMIAVAHKLIKQVYAVVKSGVKYDDNYGLEIKAN